jgi:cytochrome c-type biogenesis protein CcmH/NrfG
MRKETVITAIVFCGVGFLAGYIYDSQKNWNAPPRSASASSPISPDVSAAGSTAAQGGTSGGIPQGLPEGHPPVDNTAIIQLLEDQAAQNPKDPGPRIRLANLLFDQRQFQRAIPWYQQALELDPSNVSARTDLGTAYFNLGESGKALAQYHKSLKIDPTHEPTLFNVILVSLQGTHDLAAARVAWEQLHKRNPNYPGLESLKQDLDAARTSVPSAPAPH